MPGQIYFDNAATTPLDPRVREAMLPFLGESYGNPSSLHLLGREARAAVEHARAQVAALLNAEPAEIIFTGSGTESDNMALVGVAEAAGLPGCHIITSGIEHPAVVEVCWYLGHRGAEVTFLPTDSDGLVDPGAVADALTQQTALVSVMAANNVVGTLQPIEEIGAIARAHGALFHTDAVQAAGRVPLDVKTLPVDLLALSAHKLNGPKGVGALYVRDGVRVGPLIRGGGQERGLRSATENVAGIVGLGRAAEIARAEMAEEAAREVGLRDKIIDSICTCLPNAYLIGHRYQRLPGHVCFGLEGLEGEAVKILLLLDQAGIAVSSGSACSAHHAGEPSGVLMAMGLGPVRARGSLRVTLGRFNTEAEVDRFLDVLQQVVKTLRPISSRVSTRV